MKNTKMKQQPTFSDSCVDFCRSRTWRGEGGGGGTTPQRWFGSTPLFLHLEVPECFFFETSMRVIVSELWLGGGAERHFDAHCNSSWKTSSRCWFDDDNGNYKKIGVCLRSSTSS